MAFLDRKDRYHRWTEDRWGELPAPLLTCESVVSEACFLLRGLHGGSRAVMELLARGVVQVAFSLDREVSAVARLLAKYADLPMSLADACLVKMSELHAGSAVFTIDRDFRHYRRHSRGVIPAISPPR